MNNTVINDLTKNFRKSINRAGALDFQFGNGYVLTIRCLKKIPISIRELFRSSTTWAFSSLSQEMFNYIFNKIIEKNSLEVFKRRLEEFLNNYIARIYSSYEVDTICKCVNQLPEEGKLLLDIL